MGFEYFVPYYRRDHVTCGACGHPAERIWEIARAPVVIPDSIPGGRVVENLGPIPKRYYSKSEITHDMEILGVESHVRHVGEPGSDKSKHTSRWAGIDAQTLENGRRLVKRQGDNT